jgi:hypothetical protein
MKIEDFVLKTNDDEIPYRIFTPDKATKEFCVFWIQGWSSTMDSHREGVERMAKQSGTIFVTLDVAGHGINKIPMEKSTKKQQHEEVVAVFDELTKRGFKKIIVIGGSFGGYMTALLTGIRPVHAAILRAPANYRDEEFELPFKETMLGKGLADSNIPKDEAVNSTAMRVIRNFDGFVYVLEHELDEIVPPHVPRHYFAGAKHGNFIIIPKTKHSPKLMPNPEVHYAYIEHMIASLIEAIKLQDKIEVQ